MKDKRYTITHLGEKPMLRLRGQWLEDVGFPIGQMLMLRLSRGRLILEPISEREQRSIEIEQEKRVLTKELEVLAEEERVMELRVTRQVACQRQKKTRRGNAARDERRDRKNQGRKQAHRRREGTRH